MLSPTIFGLAHQLFFSDNMFTPVFDPEELVATIDKDGYAFAVFKEFRELSINGPNQLPADFLTARLANGDKDLEVVYGPSHARYQPNGNNIMKTNLWAQIKPWPTRMSSLGTYPPTGIVSCFESISFPFFVLWLSYTRLDWL
jgi:hypothetical protein